MFFFILFLGVIIYKLTPVFLAAYIMNKKNRSLFAGLLLGFFLGWIGVLITAVLQNRTLVNRSYTHHQNDQQQRDQTTYHENKGNKSPKMLDVPADDEWRIDWQAHELQQVYEIEPAKIAQASKRFCAYCNVEVAKTAMYCSSCGRLLDVY